MKFLKNIGMGLLIVIFLFFGLKGCLKTTVGFGKYEAYEKIDEEGQVDRLFFIPSNELILSKNYKNRYELALYHLRGSSATHYFGPLYFVGYTPFFGYRIYPGAENVWNAELELKDKIGNIPKTTFGKVGKKYSMVVIIYENSIKVDGDLYKKIIMLESDIKELRQAFNKKSTNI